MSRPHEPRRTFPVSLDHVDIGLLSGSKLPYAVGPIMQQGDKPNKNRGFIPIGWQSKELIVRGGLKLGDVDQYLTTVNSFYPRIDDSGLSSTKFVNQVWLWRLQIEGVDCIDVTIDGTHEVNEELNRIKGGGACHLREKVLAKAAETFIVVADYRENTGLLGKSNRHRLGLPEAALRMTKTTAGPIVMDNGNFCIDAPFDEAYMQDPHDVNCDQRLGIPRLMDLQLLCLVSLVGILSSDHVYPARNCVCTQPDPTR
ncbi:ribose 5-phosphate isomerase A [Rhizoctonia solani AG-1 IB]|uniref:Ribose-5-phosphate isomerase n=1 Tax=Thanatephorus cucumeris (strain AG1-IB / isolate 7/3/14) TaxID=1108050 RepID=M5C885_THACB|nr:ribose 5-phosphate isomerase A [Rhizoctonia solani AG-1 IB]